MTFGECCLFASAALIGTTLLTTACAFFAWMYEDWKKNRRDW